MDSEKVDIFREGARKAIRGSIEKWSSENGGPLVFESVPEFERWFVEIGSFSCSMCRYFVECDDCLLYEKGTRQDKDPMGAYYRVTCCHPFTRLALTVHFLIRESLVADENVLLCINAECAEMHSRLKKLLEGV